MGRPRGSKNLPHDVQEVMAQMNDETPAELSPAQLAVFETDAPMLRAGSVQIHTEETDPLPEPRVEASVAEMTPVTGGAPAPVTEALTTEERLTRVMEALAAKQGSSDNNAILKLAEAIERMTGSTIEGAKIQARATRVGQRHENLVSTGISTLNLRGEKDFPKPPLACEFMIPWLVDYDSVTREEIELLNLIASAPGEYPVRRNDGSKIKIIVSANLTPDSDKLERVIFKHDTAFNNDNHSLMPPLTDMLRGMLKSKPHTKKAADGVLTMDDEALLIREGKLNDGTIPEDKMVISMGA